QSPPPASAPGTSERPVDVTPETVRAMEKAIEEVRMAWGIPGLAVTVVAGDRVVLARGFGVRDRESKEPVGPDTRFAIGSDTKAFTATLIATVVDEGVLDWDDLVGDWVTGFRMAGLDADGKCTLRDLLCHRSGLMRTDLTWYAGTAGTDDLIRAFTR